MKVKLLTITANSNYKGIDMNDTNSIKEQLGIDFDDMGLIETIDNVTKNEFEMRAVQQYIGMAIFKDGGLLEEGECYPNEMIKQIAYDDDEVMNMLTFYASRCEHFMERL